MHKGNTGKEPSLNKALVRKRFDRHAHEYDQYADIQPAMGEALFAKVSESQGTSIHRFKRILEIGCGTGSLTRLLLDHYPDAEYTAIDISASMVEKAKDKLGSDAERVTFIVEDAEAIVETSAAESIAEGEAALAGLSDSSEGPCGSYDLIISNATFQWFNQPDLTIRNYKRLLASGGVFAFSTFIPGTFHELHASFRAAERLLGLEHIARGQSYHDGLAWSRFFEIEDRWHGLQWDWYEATQVVAYHSVLDFLYSIKRIGAGNANNRQDGNSNGMAGKQLFTAMLEHYSANYGVHAGIGFGAGVVAGSHIQATYEVGYGVYKRP